MTLPYTIANGQNPDATKLMANFSYLDGRSAARAYKTSNQSVTAGSTNKVALQAETFDTKSEFDSATNYRFTAGTAGTYLVTCAMITNDSLPTLHIYKNGSAFSKNDTVKCFTDVLQLAANDYVEFYYQNTGGSTITIFSGSNQTFMSVVQLF